MTDSEINEAVARKLGYGTPTGNALPDYCHSIKAAWEIVDKFPVVNDFRFELRFYWSGYKDGKGYGPEWMAGWITGHMRGGDREDSIKAFANTAPMAIALAFLKLP